MRGLSGHTQGGGTAGMVALLLLGLPLSVHADPAGPKVTSYFQLRLTAPGDDEAYLSLRRLKIMVEGDMGKDAGY